MKISIYDWNCAELIHCFVDEYFNDFCNENIENDISELEFAENHFNRFADYAKKLGFEVTKVR